MQGVVKRENLKLLKAYEIKSCGGSSSLNITERAYYIKIG